MLSRTRKNTGRSADFAKAIELIPNSYAEELIGEGEEQQAVTERNAVPAPTSSSASSGIALPELRRCGSWMPACPPGSTVACNQCCAATGGMCRTPKCSGETLRCLRHPVWGANGATQRLRGRIHLLAQRACIERLAFFDGGEESFGGILTVKTLGKPATPHRTPKINCNIVAGFPANSRIVLQRPEFSPKSRPEISIR